MSFGRIAVALRVARWPWLVGLLLWALSGCASPGVSQDALRTPAAAQLTVLAEPRGATVRVDGEIRGSSPLTLTLSPGEHLVELSADGYVGLTETLMLEPGREGIYAPTLVAIAPPEIRPSAEPKATATATWPSAEPRATATATPVVLARASSLPVSPSPTASATASPAASATVSPTASRPAPSPSPSPSASPAARPPTPVPQAATAFRVAEITLPTYPYNAYLKPTTDPITGYPVSVLDRAAYEAANPRPAAVKYTLIVLENEHLRLSFLPALGGRIYECIFKPTGNNEFYKNPVIKPTKWGPPSPPYPAGANWWLAAGGMEWGFPVEEHGYLWGMSWGYDHAVLPDGSVTVSLFTGDPTLPYVVVDVTLPPDVAYFVVQPTIVNPTAAPFRFQWWANAMLAPGAANKPGPELRFIFPNKSMTVHSTGDPTLPGPNQPLTWPVHNGRDLSRLGNWNQYLGFFERPAAQEGYMGVYDTAADEGMMRIFDPGVPQGAKGFGMGWAAALDARQWTDDGSGYVELHAGLRPTFNDWYELPPGGQVTWAEAWYPVAGIGGVTFAAEGGAVGLTPVGGAKLRIGLFPTAGVRGQLKVTLPGMGQITRAVDISPARPFNEVISLTGATPDRGEASLSLVDAAGGEVLAWRGDVRLR